MSDVNNYLCRLGGAIHDAKESIDQAVRNAESLNRPLGDDDGEWPAMGELLNQFVAIRDQLGALPGDEISKAINSANEELDYWADRADGSSY